MARTKVAPVCKLFVQVKSEVVTGVPGHLMVSDEDRGDLPTIPRQYRAQMPHAHTKWSQRAGRGRGATKGCK